MLNIYQTKVSVKFGLMFFHESKLGVNLPKTKVIDFGQELNFRSRLKFFNKSSLSISDNLCKILITNLNVS